MNITQLPNAQAVFVHENLDDMSTAVAQRIADLATRATSARGIFHVALAGGETPCRCYRKLRNLAIDWQHVHIYFGDERCLPNGDPQRNDSMAREILLEHVAIPPANVHTIPVELGAHAAAASYASLLSKIAPLNLILLGMGEDGHTASLFPDNQASESAATVVPVFDAPKPPSERVSLGINTLNAAVQKIFLVAGAGKHAALEQILLGNLLPAARISGAEWHLDRAATQGC
jgi:6-phosphogluconolactonase